MLKQVFSREQGLRTWGFVADTSGKWEKRERLRCGEASVRLLCIHRIFDT